MKCNNDPVILKMLTGLGIGFDCASKVRDPIINKLNKYNPYLPSAVFIAQTVVGLSKQLKQIFKLNITLLRIPTGQKANQVVVYKCSR